MLLYLSPSNWILIFLAFLLSGYLKLTSGNCHNKAPVMFATSSISQFLR
ncbi:MAG: hypothetical protein HUU57_13250 [Bdellovibrio sp.]|nr:hypothetical protein [Bdellovibrio sp.]